MSKYPEGYYVYEHYLPGQYVPFYVGKGKGGRGWVMGAKHRSEYWHRKVAKYGAPRVVIVEAGLTEARAFELEVVMIDFYKQSGVELTNLTSGGDGVPLTQEQMERRNQRIREAIATPEYKDKQRVAQKAAWSNAEIRKRRVDGIRAATQRPGFMLKRAEAVKAAFENPESKAKRSAIGKANWSRKEYRDLISEKQKAFWSTDKGKAMASVRAKQRWEQPAARELFAEKVSGDKNAMKRPEVKEKISGNKCHLYDHTKRVWSHTDGVTFIGTKNELRTKYGLLHSSVSHLVSGRYKTTGGWRYVGEYKEAA